MSSKNAKKKDKKKAKAQNLPHNSPEWKDIGLSELKELVQNLRNSLKNLQRERNLAQVECDTIQSYYEVTVQDRKDTENRIKGTEQETEKVEDENRVEKRVYAHKVRHLEYEHKTKAKNINAQKENSVRDENEDHEIRSQNLLSERNELKHELQEMDLMYSNKIKMLQTKQRKELDDVRKHNEMKLSKLVESCSERLNDLKEELNLKEKFHIHEVKEQKHLHIYDLVNNHNSAVDRMNIYYDDIAKDSTAQIKRLKESILQSQAKAETNKEQIRSTTKENEELSKPLSNAISKVSKLSEAVRHQEKDKQSLRNTKARISLIKESLKKLYSDYDALKDKYEVTKQSRDDLFQKFEESLSNTCKKSECKSIILERKLGNVKKEMEIVSGQVHEILNAIPINSYETSHIRTSLKSILKEKNSQIEHLRLEIAIGSKKYDQERKICDEEMRLIGILGTTVHKKI